MKLSDATLDDRTHLVYKEAEMDPLSEALRSLPMSGCLIARAELRAPWGLGLDRFGAAVFHVMLSGSCWLDAGEGRPVRLVSGDIAVLMQGQAHRLISEPGVAITGFSDLVEHCVPGRFPAIGIDGGGAHASMLCGFFRFDRQRTHPLLRALPDLIHVNAVTGAGPGALEGLVAIADVESAAPRPGSGALMDLLCGLLLVQMLRAQLAVDPQAVNSWILGLRDTRIGAALQLIHEAPAQAWTVAKLASSVAMSRSGFAALFAECVGEAPMHYLARCRILRAAQVLGAEGLPVVEAMHVVGYQSESSFSKSFQRFLGSTPAAYRRSFRSRDLSGAVGPDHLAVQGDKAPLPSGSVT
jgi:AraC-like DNA-binding protein